MRAGDTGPRGVAAGAFDRGDSVAGLTAGNGHREVLQSGSLREGEAPRCRARPLEEYPLVGREVGKRASQLVAVDCKWLLGTSLAGIARPSGERFAPALAHLGDDLGRVRPGSRRPPLGA